MLPLVSDYLPYQSVINSSEEEKKDFELFPDLPQYIPPPPAMLVINKTTA